MGTGEKVEVICENSSDMLSRIFDMPPQVFFKSYIDQDGDIVVLPVGEIWKNPPVH